MLKAILDLIGQSIPARRFALTGESYSGYPARDAIHR
jgi:hypothetical protein